MKILSAILPISRPAIPLKKVASEIAWACRSDVWVCVRPRAGSMTAAQFRGYVTAHANRLLESETDAALKRHGLGGEVRSELREQSLKRLIQLALNEMFHARPAAPTRQAA